GAALEHEQWRVSAYAPKRSPLRAPGHHRPDRRDRGAARRAPGAGSGRSPSPGPGYREAEHSLDYANCIRWVQPDPLSESTSSQVSTNCEVLATAIYDHRSAGMRDDDSANHVH